MKPLAFLAPSILALSVLASPSLALALSEDGANTLRSIDYYKTQVDLKTRPFANGDSDYTIGQAMYQYETKLKTVKERLEKVPAADRSDPKYEATAKWVGEFESTLKKWQAERGTNTQNLKAKAAAEEAYKTESRNLGDALGFVKAVRGTYSYDLEPAAMLAKWRSAEALTAFAAKCDREFAAVDATSYYGREKVEACKNAAEWRTVLKPFLDARAQAKAKKLGDSVAATLTRIRNGESVDEAQLDRARKPTEYLASLRGSYEALYTAMGAPLPAGLFSSIESAAAGYAAAVTAGQAKVSYKPGRFSDPAVSAAVKAALATSKVKVVKISQTFGDWDIRKSGLMPTHRIRDSVVLGQAAGETHCRVYTITTSQQYAGGGRYAGNLSVDLGREPAFLIASCK